MKKDFSGIRESGSSGPQGAMPTKREHGTRRFRRGAVLIVVLACLAVTLLVMVSLLRLAAAERSQMQVGAWQAQARWLAESALERAAARLAADPKYNGETWSLAAEALGGRDGAVVKIEVVKIKVETPTGQPARRLVRVQADYPDHPHLRVRQSRQLAVEIPKAGEKP